jgi:hypothetical protein
MARRTPTSAAFKAWFGDSKVVDPRGRPLRVYHGTYRGGFESFGGAGRGEDAGFFFTDDPLVAWTYAHSDEQYPDILTTKTDRRFGIPALYEVYLRIENPLVVDAGGDKWNSISVYRWPERERDMIRRAAGNRYASALSTDALAFAARELGHDGLIVQDVVDDEDGVHGLNDEDYTSTIYVVFHSRQVKSANMNSGKYSLTDASILKNPYSFTVLPEGREVINMRERAAASLYSPIKHKAITELTKDTPHDYHIVLSPTLDITQEELDKVIRPDALTLIHLGRPGYTRTKGEPDSVAIFTAFTYLHRLGDVVGANVLKGRGSAPSVWQGREVGDVFSLRRSVLPAPALTTNPPPNRELALAVREAERQLFERAKALCKALSDATDLSEYGARGYDKRYASPFSRGDLGQQFRDVASILATRVNSKMVRERFALDEGQAASDLFALAELTPPSRPLLRAYTQPEEIKTWGWGSVPELRLGLTNPAAMQALNAYIADHNVLWRRWHDLFIRANYGAAASI